MAAKNRIQIEHYDDKPLGVIGISCHQPDYKAVWAIGQSLQLEFEKQPDIRLVIQKKPNFYESVFTFYSVDLEDIKICVVTNKDDDGVLLPEISKFDFVLLVYYENNSDVLQQFCERLRRSPYVQFCMQISASTLRNRNRLPEF